LVACSFPVPRLVFSRFAFNHWKRFRVFIFHFPPTIHRGHSLE
jgi:hypothetical protein